MNIEILHGNREVLVDTTKFHCWRVDKDVGEKFVDQLHLNVATLFVIGLLYSLDAEVTVQEGDDIGTVETKVPEQPFW